MELSEEKRHFHRILYNADAVLNQADKQTPCEILDLSLHGCLLQFEAPWSGEQDAIHTLDITLTDSISIKMEISATHVIGDRAGFKCEHIDIDSISRLRRLIELNLGDSAILERDILALSGLDVH